MKPRPFDGLKSAIEDVLVMSKPFTHPEFTEYCFVEKKALTILQGEYNIHFVEPDAPQLEIIR